MKKSHIFITFLFFCSILFINNLFAQSNWSTDVNGIFYNSGNVGIGNNPSPDAKLSIFDNTRRSEIAILRPYSGSSNTIIANFDLINAHTGDYVRTALRLRDGRHQLVQTAYSNTLSSFIAFSLVDFTTANYSITNGVNNVFFENIGAVGIGITETDVAKLAGAKLGVNGKIIAEEVEVKLFANWPDFVFHDDYSLMPLSELANHIEQNRHLPNVPTEAEVMENGVNLGEMSAILLQKVEELTLYVIDLNNQNKELQRRISELEK